MKKIPYLVFAVIIISSSLNAVAQGFLNKVKSKANQELNKLENNSVNKTTPANTTPTKNILSANVTRTVVLTLGDQENFDYQESCIDLGASLNQISFTLNKPKGNSMQCYSYKNGVRTPIACPTNNSGCHAPLQCSFSKLRPLEEGSDEFKKYVIDKTSTTKIQGMTDEQMKQMSAYMTKEQMDEMKKAMKQASEQSITAVESRTINFNGKKYGPFKMIMKLFLTADGKQFYAIVTEGTDNVHYKTITSASAATLIFATFGTFDVYASPDNSEFAMYTADETGQNYAIKTSSGKTYKVSEPGFFRGAWYSAIGNHILIYSKQTLTIDGKVVKTFGEFESHEPCDIFVSSDGSGIAYIQDNNLSFPDGDYFQYPLKIALINSGGKVYFKWLALEDRQIVLYQKPF